MFQNRDRANDSPQETLAMDCLAAGIAAAAPDRVIEAAVSIEGDRLTVGDRSVSLDEYDRILVIGGGNAAGGVATALEDLLGDRIDDGIILTDDPKPTDHIRVLEGRHPVPDKNGLTGTRDLLQLADDAAADTLVITVIGGGGSALLPAPAGPVTLEDIQRITSELLDAGAPIEDLNAVRKHLSEIKGGRLADRLAPADVIGLILSDVVGDDPAVVASGPLTPDKSSYEDAIAALERYAIDPPSTVQSHLEAGVSGEHPETPTPGDPVFDTVSTHVIATNRTAIDAAARRAREEGYQPLILSTRIEGEARDVGQTHAAVGIEALQQGNPIEPPAVILSGGETTVTVRGTGTGGPNQEVALAAGISLARESVSSAVVASVDTDGIDGASDAAGGIVNGETVDDVRTARAALDNNDAGSYLSDHAGLLTTGPTGTNVNDLRVVILGNPPNAESL